MNNLCLACPSCIRRLEAMDLKDGDWCPMHRSELRPQGQSTHCDHHQPIAGTKDRARNRAERRHPGRASG